jgi:hypothetical protein
VYWVIMLYTLMLHLSRLPVLHHIAIHFVLFEVDDSSKRDDCKIRRNKTRSAIVVIYYNSIELRDILSKLVVVCSCCFI